MNSGLGLNITPDLTNDFFQIKPKSKNTEKKFIKHHIGSSQYVSRANSGTVTPHLVNDKRQNIDHQETIPSNTGNVSFNQTLQQPINELLLPEPESEVIYPKDQNIGIEVYDNFSFDHKYDNTLPITDSRELIVQTIDANRATVIQGSTGSGKTTQVPQYILDDFKQKGKYCNILVTQPRRIAALSVAKRVAEERKWDLGTLVGYQIARDRKVSEDTRITYMTTGVLMQKLIKEKSLGEYTHIILDEVHERDQDIDFALLVVRKYLRTVSRHVKVVLMSATVESSLFSNYFSILINGKPEGCPVISVDGKLFRISKYYFEDVACLSEVPQQSIYEPEISEKCYQLCREIILQLDKDELMEKYKENMVGKDRGTVLCFLPGVPEITEMMKYLDDIEEIRKLKVIPLHSQISSKDQSIVFVKAPFYYRKVILATNIAESSITVPDIKYVIDFCLTKSNETDPDTNYQQLVLQWASKASLTQRKGRAGRVSEGHCFRLISSKFVKQFQDYCVPEMLRSPLEQVLLKVKLLELGPPAQVLGLALQPPNITYIKRTILMLKEVGALTVRQNNHINPLDGDLTFVGRVLGALPVDVHIGKLLLIGYTFGVLEECLVIGACLSLKSIFSKPFRQEMKAYTNKMHWAKFSSSDLIASLNAFVSWKFRKEHIGFNEPESRWAHRNLLEYKRLKEVDLLVKELEERLKSFNIFTHRNIYKRDDLDKENEFVLKIVIAGAYYPSYFHTQEIEEAEATKTLSGHNPFTTVVVHGAPPTLCHYRSSVANLFRQCGRGKRLYFENSRAFIEFENEQSGESPVTVAVYKAIKLRHLRVPLNILVSKKNDEKFRQTLLNKPLLSHNPETGLLTNRVNTGLGKEGTLSVTLQGNPRQVKLQETGYINLIIQECINPGHFWATYSDQETQKRMLQLHNKLNEFSGRNLKPMRTEDIRVGSYCLAPFEDEFFRAEIIQCSDRHVKVFFLDYGNTSTIYDRKQIRICQEALLNIPFQAFECYLCEIRPIRGTWTEEAALRFNEVASPGAIQLIGKVYSLIHGTYRLEIFNNDKSINRLLIEEGHAMYCEEPLSSKQRHEEMVNFQGASSKKASSDTYVAEGSRIERGEEVLKISLRGPFSPFEVSFFGLTASAKLRASRVEQDSVNSVVMCEEPQDKHPRLLVAASVNINPSGNTIIARETTYLPNIHGLTSMLPLLFAPVAEFRCDKEETCITGAICGLGCDDMGAPILPDHDIEIAFDVKFAEKDFGMINGVRYLINYAIGIKEERIDLPAHKIADVQKYARDKLLELINTHREDMEVVHYRNEYRWNQLNPESVLECGYQEEATHLYAYHKGIFFQENTKEVVDPRIVKQREQLNELHKLAGKSLIPFNTSVVCPVCSVQCRHPRGLYLHCETPQHRNWCTQIFKEQPS